MLWRSIVEHTLGRRKHISVKNYPWCLNHISTNSQKRTEILQHGRISLIFKNGFAAVAYPYRSLTGPWWHFNIYIRHQVAKIIDLCFCSLELISGFPDNLKASKLLLTIFRVGLVYTPSRNMPCSSFFEHLGCAKTLSCQQHVFLQKLVFLQRITRNHFDNPRSIWYIESI